MHIQPSFHVLLLVLCITPTVLGGFFGGSKHNSDETHNKGSGLGRNLATGAAIGLAAGAGGVIGSRVIDDMLPRSEHHDDEHKDNEENDHQKNKNEESQQNANGHTGPGGPAGQTNTFGTIIAGMPYTCLASASANGVPPNLTCSYSQSIQQYTSQSYLNNGAVSPNNGAVSLNNGAVSPNNGAVSPNNGGWIQPNYNGGQPYLPNTNGGPAYPPSFTGPGTNYHPTFVKRRIKVDDKAKA